MLYPNVREARFHEIPDIARLNSLAFWDHELIGERMHPSRQMYPTDFDLHWLRMARPHYFDPKWRFIVAMVKDKAGKEVIAGCGLWSKMGDGGKGIEYGWFDPRKKIRPSAHGSSHEDPCARIWPNRAVDPAEEDVIERAMPLVADSWAGDRAECWNLEIMAVHPEHQGRGVGRLIVKWGLGRVDEKRVCASVISSKGKKPFYLKCGFNFEDGRVGRGEGNPLAWWDGGRMFWRIPGTTV